VVAAHGNSLRALIMVLEELSPEGILKRDLGTGVPIIFASTTIPRWSPSSTCRGDCHSRAMRMHRTRNLELWRADQPALA
jgi:hypothetical protein